MLHFPNGVASCTFLTGERRGLPSTPDHDSFVDPQGATRPRPLLALRPRLLRVRQGTGVPHVGLLGPDGEDEGHDEPGVGHNLPHRLLLRGETGE